MDKKKWEKIAQEEVNKIDQIESPEEWPTAKKQILTIVEEIDKATEVYNLENNKSQK